MKTTFHLNEIFFISAAIAAEYWWHCHFCNKIMRNLVNQIFANKVEQVIRTEKLFQYISASLNCQTVIPTVSDRTTRNHTIHTHLTSENQTVTCVCMNRVLTVCWCFCKKQSTAAQQIQIIVLVRRREKNSSVWSKIFLRERDEKKTHSVKLNRNIKFSRLSKSVNRF